MNNEIGRKITSLTLMAIMVAGGMTFAVPGVMPAAHAANANLFVSAENSQFDNYMSGPQVIEVVVIDSDINDTNEGEGEPDVTVNGKKLRMTQATDGNWYGYFADKLQATTADQTTVGNAKGGIGLDFGQFCGKDSTKISDDDSVLFSDTVGVAVPFNSNTTATTFGVNGTTSIVDCNTAFRSEATTIAGEVVAKNGTANVAMNVLREAKDVNTELSGNIGQINLNDADFWPFIQLYDLTVSGNVVVQYNKGGGVQSTTLTFDTVEDYADLTLDRAVYPRSAQVHATITDLWLNIDPTDEDSWTFAAVDNSSKRTAYQVFDENGLAQGNTTSNLDADLTDVLSTLMCEDNCVLLFNPDVQGTGDVVTLQDNDDTVLDFAPAGGSDADEPADFGIKVGPTLDAGTSAFGMNGKFPITFTEQGPNSGVFGTYDESDASVLKIVSDAARGTSGSLDYNETPVTILVGHDFASVDIQPADDEWNSGEDIPVVIVDGDANQNSRSDEDLDLNNHDVSLIPALSTGDPVTLGEAGSSSYDVLLIQATGTPAFTGATAVKSISTLTGSNVSDSLTVQDFSQRGLMTSQTGGSSVDVIAIETGITADELRNTVKDTQGDATDRLFGVNLLNLDVRSFSTTATWDVYILNASSGTNLIDSTSLGDQTGTGGANNTITAIGPIADDVDSQSLTSFNGTTTTDAILDAIVQMDDNDVLGLLLVPSTALTIGSDEAIAIDFFSFGFTENGITTDQRVANQIIRIEAEETGDNTSTFEGSLEYVMVNQINIQVEDTFTGISPIADDPSFIVIEDLTDEDAPRVTYNDLGADGVITPVSDQEEAPSHSGVVSFNQDSYKIADTVVITLEDADLNVDVDLIDIFTVVSVAGDDAAGSVQTQDLSWGQLGRLLDVTFDDQPWSDNSASCSTSPDFNGLKATGFTLVETGSASGVFTGDFQIPSNWCRDGETTKETATGLDIEVNYVDFRDASGEIVEVGDSAGVRANTGSVSLDRTVYPVPFGTSDDFTSTNVENPNGRSVFPIHASGLTDDNTTLGDDEQLPTGDLTIHVRVNDPDFDVNPAGEDFINQNTTSTDVGPVKISVIRGADTVVLGYAGGDAELDGTIDVGDNRAKPSRQFGPMSEIAPDAGIYEIDIPIKFTDGPAHASCPDNVDYTPLNGDSATGTNGQDDRFDATDSNEYCILQGDILQVEYTDPADASGDVNTVTDSATFDLRNGVLQSDKSVYIIGSDMILTLIEPDFDLDNDAAETYDLDLIEWDSDAATITMGDKGGATNEAAFDPEPTDFRETGDSTGIFQIVIEIPEELSGDKLERGEEIILEYTDWGPSGSDYVGDEDEDVNLTIYTSNFGATVELDQKVYTWTDKVYITIVAPDHNFDSDLVDEIGDSDDDPIKVSTRGFDLDNYKLVETGTDTGIFTGEVILTGFTPHDADGDGSTDDVTGTTSPETGGGPTNGFLGTDDDDGLTVSFEFSEDETIVGSALIRWNIGEVQWLEASYPASGTGVVRVIDPDMNLDPEAVDNFDVDVWSDSDAGGIDLTVTETNEATGIFEGTVFFTTLDESSGHRLRVSEGDTVTAEYEDNTLPDPYTTADELDITATSLIGTVVPPLERAPAANLRTVDAFGNSLDSVSVDQQVQISADLANGQDREQSFAYLVQIQDANGVTVSLAWITGSLSAGQSFSPALSWIPTDAGTYTATAFVWESVDNPTALSPPVSTTVNVS